MAMEEEQVGIIAVNAMTRSYTGKTFAESVTEAVKESESGFTIRGETLEISATEAVVVAKSGREYIITGEYSIEKVLPITISGTEIIYKRRYSDKGKNVAQVPTGFTADSTPIDEGRVITAKSDSSQFVWVPVSNMYIYDITPLSDANINAALANEVSEGYYPMAIKIGKDYKGVLYNFTGTNPVIIVPRIYTTGGTGSREPDIVQSYDNSHTNFTDAGITEVSSETPADDFQAILQTEFNLMMNSVAKNGGFYIGRFQTSIASGEGTTSAVVQSKGNEPAMNGYDTSGQRWYGMYEKQKRYADSKTGVSGGMIWGSQWDQVMIWMKDVPNVGDFNKRYIRDSSGMGWYLDQTPDTNNLTRITGKSVDLTNATTPNKVKNIWDMAGNIFEWTIEANGEGRIFRGRLLWR